MVDEKPEWRKPHRKERAIVHLKPVNRKRHRPFDAPEEYAGYLVRDPLGQEIGSAEEVLVDGRGEPVYIKIRMTSSSQKSVLIPVRLVAVDDERRTLVLR